MPWEDIGNPILVPHREIGSKRDTISRGLILMFFSKFQPKTMIAPRRTFKIQHFYEL